MGDFCLFKPTRSNCVSFLPFVFALCCPVSIWPIHPPLLDYLHSLPPPSRGSGAKCLLDLLYFPPVWSLPPLLKCHLGNTCLHPSLTILLNMFQSLPQVLFLNLQALFMHHPLHRPPSLSQHQLRSRQLHPLLFWGSVMSSRFMSKNVWL